MARDGDKRRAEITVAAFELIAEKGLERFRVRDLAAKAGLNIATLHYYFSTKEELILAVVEHMLSFFMTEGASSGNGELTAADELREEAKRLEKHVREHPEMFVAMAEFTARACRDEAIREMLARLDYGWRSRLAAIVMRGHRDGTIRADLDPLRAASILSFLMKGMCTQAVCGLDAPDFSAVAEEVRQWVSAKP
jgi:AcrR family transcriptional regulator